MMREARYGEAEPSPHNGRQSRVSVAQVGCGKAALCLAGYKIHHRDTEN